MAANRKFPFGYEMQKGLIVLHPSEAETVRWIYQQYVAGASYARLAQELQYQFGPYLPGTEWNKNTVARILADRRYTGTERFPQVVDAALFQASRETVRSRVPTRRKKTSVGTIQRLAVCSVCGERACRASRQHGRERWYCPRCNSISTKATDAKLERGVIMLLDSLIRSPQAVISRPDEADTASPQATSLELGFTELVSTPNFDEAAAKRSVLALAAARFDAVGTQDYAARLIRYKLEQAQAGSALAPKLVIQIANAILINPDGEVSLKLKNGQIIDKE